MGRYQTESNRNTVEICGPDTAQNMKSHRVTRRKSDEYGGCLRCDICFLRPNIHLPVTSDMCDIMSNDCQNYQGVRYALRQVFCASKLF